MKELGVGVITKLVDGNFDNQYNVEIAGADGQVLGGFDGISVYSHKQDGSESKVWPLVQESKFQGKPFLWKANVKETETKGGPKTYATIVWAEPPDDGAGGGTNGQSGVWGSASSSSEATPQPTQDPTAGDWSIPKQEVPQETPPAVQQGAVTRDDYWERKELADIDRSLQMESAWAVKAVMDVEPDLIKQPDGENQILQYALRLVILKRRMAQELSDG